ncbi:TIGR04211 family SH3 domain-containing protein [Cellvibrio sp. PSBB006]|uniref:TIGR04211 family SH3 domain-containing protein n=1 Tax=Cellvibrio sp. PSBB006 TaxID=1987723 RepID=UPI001E35C61C|nr:TIGR04211 family SH3 domain-containing protein [Cellvibrio sp. PSBB006]
MKKNLLIPPSMRLALICSLISVVVSLNVFAQANVRYISDVMYVPLRAGMSNNTEVVKAALTSGTRLRLVREEQDASNDAWALVETTDGVQGWIRTQHLINEPTAAIKLERVNAQLAKASSSAKEALERQKAHDQLQVEHETLQQEYQALIENTESLRQTSAAAVDLEQENQRIHENNQLLQTRVDVLQAENEQLRDAERYNQWVYGAGLLICGVILSFLLQALGKRKRQSEWR